MLITVAAIFIVTPGYCQSPVLIPLKKYPPRPCIVAVVAKSLGGSLLLLSVIALAILSFFSLLLTILADL
jgi:hypothetical protein